MTEAATSVTDRSTQPRAAGLPPGPPLPRSVMMTLWVRWPVQVMRHCRRRYGGTFTMRLPFIGTVVLFSDPDAINCLGMAFPLYEMRVVLATVLPRFVLEAAPGHRTRLVRRAITFAPSGGMPIVVRPRAGPRPT